MAACNTPSEPWYVWLVVMFVGLAFIWACVGAALGAYFGLDWFWHEVVCEDWIVCQ